MFHHQPSQAGSSENNKAVNSTSSRRTHLSVRLEGRTVSSSTPLWHVIMVFTRQLSVCLSLSRSDVEESYSIGNNSHACSMT